MDNLTCSLIDIKSGGELFKLFNQFESCSGLRVNKTKTEALWLGKNKGNSETPCDIAWPKTPIRILGVYLGHETIEVEKANLKKPLLPPPRRLCFRLGLSVCLFVCEQDNSKTYGRIFIKFSGYVRNGKRKK